MINIRKLARWGLVSGGALAAAPLIAACITNPGNFTATVQSPSSMVVKDADGGNTFTLDIGRPACADEIDNDADGIVDSADPECASGGDANERLAGAQAYVQSVTPFSLAENGDVTYDPTAVSIQQREFCLVGGTDPWCLGLSVKGVGSPTTVTTNVNGFDLPLTVEIEIDAVAGFADLPADCEISPIPSVFTMTAYTEETGLAVLDDASVTIPAVTTCGVWNDAVNNYLGLPADGVGHLEAIMVDGSGTPPQFE